MTKSPLFKNQRVPNRAHLYYQQQKNKKINGTKIRFALDEGVLLATS